MSANIFKRKREYANNVQSYAEYVQAQLREYFADEQPKLPTLVWTLSELSDLIGENVERYELTDEATLKIHTATNIIFLNPKTMEII